jgi:hypothetical protein
MVLPWHFRGMFIPRRQVWASIPYAASNTTEPSSITPRCSNLHRYETMETQILQGLLLLEVSSQDNGNLVCISTKLITMFSGTNRHHTLSAYRCYRPIQVPLAVHKSSHPHKPWPRVNNLAWWSCSLGTVVLKVVQGPKLILMTWCNTVQQTRL